MAIFSFTFGASFTFETGTSPTALPHSASLVRNKDGTNGPEHDLQKNLRLVGEKVIGNVATNAASSAHRSPVSPCDPFDIPPALLADHSCIDPSLTLDQPSVATAKTTDSKKKEEAQAFVATSKASTDQLPRCRFLELPQEIRLIIYGLILISSESPIEVHKLLDPFGSINVVDQPPRIKGIDSKFLRTCSKVLYEAAPVLYGKNTFLFSRHRHIDDFQGRGGGSPFTKTCSPPWEHTELWGRLCMLRKVEVRFNRCYHSMTIRHRTVETPKMRRDAIWTDWKKFFEPGCYEDICFPALDTLTLEFFPTAIGEWGQDSGGCQSVVRRAVRRK